MTRLNEVKGRSLALVLGRALVVALACGVVAACQSQGTSNAEVADLQKQIQNQAPKGLPKDVGGGDAVMNSGPGGGGAGMMVRKGSSR